MYVASTIATTSTVYARLQRPRLERSGTTLAGAESETPWGRIRFEEGYNRMLWTALRRKAAYLPG